MWVETCSVTGLVPGAASSEQVVFDTKIPDLFSGLVVACTYVAGDLLLLFVCLFVFGGGGGVIYRCQTRKRWGRGEDNLVPMAIGHLH